MIHRSDRRAPVFDAMGSSMRRVGFIVTAICAAVAVLALAPAARADGTPPQVWIDSGYYSPVQGGVTFVVHARTSNAGATLGNAALTLDGSPIPGAAGALTCAAQPCTDGTASLSFDSRTFPDGTYDLAATAADSAGRVGSYHPASFEIWNNRPSGSSSATLTIGSGVPAPPPQAQNPGSGVLGASAGSCVKPKLSMRLSQKPLRIKHGVPVLKKGKRYRFSGRLTCLVNKKRVSAPKRTRVELRQIVHGRSHLKGHGTVGSHGKLVVRFSVPSSRTLEFRFTTADKKVTRVRIKVRVVKATKKKHEKG